jgi:DNA-binding response OmpR family regulator
MAKILLIEDDANVTRMVSHYLTVKQHIVESAPTGDAGWDCLRHYAFDIVILDWELPNLSGIEILKNLRDSRNHVPVIMLTGRIAFEDKAAGFNCGADDYLTKPFDIRELGLRLDALLRRPRDFHNKHITAGDLRLDEGTRVAIKNGQQIPLLAKEYALLEFLMRHPNQYFTPDTILNRVWPSESDATVEAIRTCVKRIRQKLDDNDDDYSVIESTRGLGYKFVSISK